MSGVFFSVRNTNRCDDMFASFITNPGIPPAPDTSALYGTFASFGQSTGLMHIADVSNTSTIHGRLLP
jgi:hypothetical protein